LTGYFYYFIIFFIMKRKIYLFFLLIFVLSMVFLSDCKKREVKNCNVVVIVIDALRADHLPPYGYKKMTAPFITELSKKSVVFHHAFAASSWTAPATASIFTSLYPFQHGVLMGLLAIRIAQSINPNVIVNKIPSEINTMPEVMKSFSYRTFGIADNLNISKLEGFDQGFDKFETKSYVGAKKIYENLLRWEKEIKENGKYFLYIHFMDPHAPYHGREPLYRKKEKFEDDIKSRYDSEIYFADIYIKKLYEKFGWNKNTLLIITSDHGEGLWDHGWMDHGHSLYYEEIHVPLIIYYPEIKKRKNIYTPVSTIDILPTIRGILGYPIGTEEEGKNLLPLIEGKKNSLNKRYLLLHLWKKVRKEIEHDGVIYGRWHFILENGKNRMLFDMGRDRKERFNIYSGKKKLGKQLENFFFKFKNNCKKYVRERKKIKLNKKDINKLKSLGYVN